MNFSLALGDERGAFEGEERLAWQRARRARRLMAEMVSPRRDGAAERLGDDAIDDASLRYPAPSA